MEQDNKIITQELDEESLQEVNGSLALSSPAKVGLGAGAGFGVTVGVLTGAINRKDGTKNALETGAAAGGMAAVAGGGAGYLLKKPWGKAAEEAASAGRELHV